MAGCRTDRALLEENANLRRLIALSSAMAELLDEGEIVDRAMAAVASLTPCSPVAALVGAGQSDGAGRSDVRTPDGRGVDRPELAARLAALGDADGDVAGVVGTRWATAYALRAVDAHAGHLVVACGHAPHQEHRVVLRLLVQQTNLALGTARLHGRERAAAREMKRVNASLEEANGRLTAAVVDLQRRRQAHERLAGAVAAETGEAGIAAEVHRLTGLPVAVEDAAGGLRAWAGPGRPERPRPDLFDRAARRRRTALLAEASRSPAPVRDRDRLVAVARPRDEVLGVLALVDPGGRAGEYEAFVLQHGALMLTVELSHQRNLVESELRLRRDLVDDLLAGTDVAGARSRAEALGHDLTSPHRVLVLRWPAEEGLVRAVEQASRAALGATPLLARRPDGIVLVAPEPDQPDGRSPWEALHRAVTDRLPGVAGSPGAIGVGAVCHEPAGLARSFLEARRALTVRLGCGRPAGVTRYEDLGVYRVLTVDGDDGEVRGYVREWLGPLLDYDSTNGAELVRTVWQYLEQGGNYDATARALLIHRSTLRYRLRRIREISGLDLGAVDTRLNLHVAARAWHLLQGEVSRTV
ncbi:helix-turn-helix domain-containing protein [Pseudonocardia kujensis]|uniref:helix-turn-helix domain-containing protein n=1 Tax=Pseudonocardia kujensis TaxID=1128675 RepID=UPI001E3D563E|nr:helix-turn-helix domain-containing protein [Pseudonocardia kujensis]MCE0762878.1 helix-turn-helix domain-containing protein [Pseudonocardia kujensis]